MHSSKRKGDRAELEVQGILRDLRMKPCRDCGTPMEMRPGSRRVYCEDCRRKRGALKQAKRRDKIKSGPLDPRATWHGTAAGYSTYSCRCEPCRTAYRAYNDEWRKRPEVAERIRTRARELAKRPAQVLKKKAYQYGLDSAHLADHMAERVCFACGAVNVDLSIDHDHACCPSSRKVCGECVRGLLCRGCNYALGNVRDSRQRLLDLIAYLDRWEAKRASQ